MAFKAVVRHGGGLAHYILTTEKEGIYQAHLMRFDGRPDRAPARRITLLKTADSQWTGDGDVPKELLHELGVVLETKLRQMKMVHVNSMPAAPQSQRT